MEDKSLQKKCLRRNHLMHNLPQTLQQFVLHKPLECPVVWAFQINIKNVILNPPGPIVKRT